MSVKQGNGNNSYSGFCEFTPKTSVSQKTNGLQIRRIQTQWTITCCVQCWRLIASLKQSRKQSPNSRKCFRLSGATYHKDRSTKLWKTSQNKRLKACVGAWSYRWTLRTFTVTMEFRHLIISKLCCLTGFNDVIELVL